MNIVLFWGTLLLIRPIDVKRKRCHINFRTPSLKQLTMTFTLPHSLSDIPSKSDCHLGHGVNVKDLHGKVVHQNPRSRFLFTTRNSEGVEEHAVYKCFSTRTGTAAGFSLTLWIDDTDSSLLLQSRSYFKVIEISSTFSKILTINKCYSLSCLMNKNCWL